MSENGFGTVSRQYSRPAHGCQGPERTDAFAKDFFARVANSPIVPQPRRPMVMRFLRALTLRRAISGIVVVAFAFTLLAAVAMRVVEPQTFHTYGQACWWSAQTVSTVGYGDDVPVTAAGKIVAVIVMLFAVALVPAITSLVVAVFMNQQMNVTRDRRPQ
jgi:voltage-gated potassium channel Kch